MKKTYTKRQIMESIKYWQKQLKLGNYKRLNEGITSDAAMREASAIRDDIDDYAFNANDLFSWANDNTLHIVDLYGNELYDNASTNLEKVKRYVEEISWEHGDIDDDAIAYEDYFNELIDAVESKNSAKAEKWLNSTLP